MTKQELMPCREIVLPSGHIVLVDAEDHGHLTKWKWQWMGNYAARRIWNRKEGHELCYMHRFIMVPSEEMSVDHINGNRLDNRKSNLRICTFSQNMMNRGANKTKDRTSGYKGVCWHKRDKKWRAQITKEKEKIFLGYFKSEEDAARAYNEAALRMHGEFAFINHITTGGEG